MAKSRSIAAALIAVAAATLTLTQALGQKLPEAARMSKQPAQAHMDLPEASMVTAAKVAPVLLEQYQVRAPEPAAPPLPPMTVVAQAADGTIVFVEDAGSHIDGATSWPTPKLAALVGYYEEAVALYTSETGFGSLERWTTAVGASRENPIRVVYAGGAADAAPARAAWVEGTAVITHYQLRTSVRTKCVQLIVHELAHVWDGHTSWGLGEAIATTVDNANAYPTAKARDEGPREDFAESVTASLWPGYAVNDAWADDGADVLDRYDYVRGLFREEAVSDQLSAVSLTRD